MKRLKRVALCFVMAGLGVAAYAQSNAPMNTMIVARSGIVEIQRGGGWVPLGASDPVNMGDRIRTGSGSSAAIQIEPGKIVTLREGSQIQIRGANGMPLVHLDSGDMKVFSASDIQVSAKDTVLETAERPLDMELGFQGDRLNVMVLGGAVRNGQVVIRGIQNLDARTFTANSANVLSQRNGYQVVYPNVTIYPYFYFRNSTQGSIVPPTVLNPTNPGYRPTQIVPPMTDPIRPPVQRPPGNFK